jgi:hypothetical protein
MRLTTTPKLVDCQPLRRNEGGGQRCESEKVSIVWAHSTQAEGEDHFAHANGSSLCKASARGRGMLKRGGAILCRKSWSAWKSRHFFGDLFTSCVHRGRTLGFADLSLSGPTCPQACNTRVTHQSPIARGVEKYIVHRPLHLYTSKGLCT